MAKRKNTTKKYVLITIDINWADEIDFNGFSVLDKEVWEEFVEFVDRHPDESFTFYFGTNEESVYTCSEILNCMSVTNVSAEQYELLKKLDLTEGGLIPEDFIDKIYDNIEDYDEDDDEDEDDNEDKDDNEDEDDDEDDEENC